MPVKQEKFASFQKTVWEYYRHYGRDLPWRHTVDPYQIWISEVMLQQTQVARVVPKYNHWMEIFPTIADLKRATLREVLHEWQGLGYNRRALQLHKGAVVVVRDFGGALPNDGKALRSIPGIGPYTAAAICAFAFNMPTVFIETNIRTAFIYHFKPRAKKVSDKKLLPLIKRTLDYKNPREWYWALMDYGAYIKSEFGNAGRRGAAYTKQSPFRNSNRQMRGRIIRSILSGEENTIVGIAKKYEVSPKIVERAIAQLNHEGIIHIQKNKLLIN